MTTNLGGKIQGVSLDSFIQIVQMDQISCTLKVTSTMGFGFLYFVQGELFSATTGDIHNAEAACRIISWEDAVIEIEKTCDKTTNEINQPLMNILMEGMRLRDEAQAAPEYKARIEAPPPEAPSAETPPETDRTPDTETESNSAPAPETEGGAAPQNTFRKWIFVTLAPVIILAAGAAYYVLQARQARQTYENTVAKAQNQIAVEKRIGILNAYIAEHGASQFSEDAARRIEKIQSQMASRDYSAAENQADLLIEKGELEEAMAVFIQYEKKHPKTLHPRQLVQRKKELVYRIDKRAFERLVSASEGIGPRRMDLYLEFQKKYPDSQFLKQVKEMISEMSNEYYIFTENRILENENRGDWEKCLDLSQQYIDIFPDVEHTVVLKKYQRLCTEEIKAAKAYRALVKQSAAYGTDYDAAIKVFSDYLRAYPGTRAKDKISNDIKKLEALSEKQRLSAEIGNMTTRLAKLGKRFKVHGTATVSDTDTGLMWTLLDATTLLNRCLDYKEAQTFVQGLDTGGHTDWRLPTPQELTTLYRQKPYFPAPKPGWFWTSQTQKRYLGRWMIDVDVVTTETGTQENRGKKESWHCGSVRAVRGHATK